MPPRVPYPPLSPSSRLLPPLLPTPPSQIPPRLHHPPPFAHSRRFLPSSNNSYNHFASNPKGNYAGTPPFSQEYPDARSSRYPTQPRNHHVAPQHDRKPDRRPHISGARASHVQPVRQTARHVRSTSPMQIDTFPKQQPRVNACCYPRTYKEALLAEAPLNPSSCKPTPPQ